MISGSNDKTIKLWKLETDEEFFTFTGRTAYSLLTKWKHLQVEEELYTFTDHTDAVNAVAVTPDGKQFISASSDNTLKVWDLESRRLIASFSGESPLNCCAVAPDGVTIVAGEASGRVHFLRLEGM